MPFTKDYFFRIGKTGRPQEYKYKCNICGIRILHTRSFSTHNNKYHPKEQTRFFPSSRMKPYYQDESVTIYNADCRDVLPTLEKVDLVLTDPPYGIADVWKGGGGHGWAKSMDESVLRNEWDARPPDSALMKTICNSATASIIWGGNYFDLPVSRGWLIWNKPERNFTLGEAELAWTNRDTVIRVYDANRSDVGRTHPTQKPISLMKWCIETAANNPQTILDPFMGSGTTLRGAKDLGRKAIGIELEERYCEIAAKRMSQLAMQL